jgi:hypothetical protein
MRTLLVAMICGFILLLPAGFSSATTCIALPPLKPIHQAVGVVIDPSGEPIPNAKVAVLKDGREIVAMQTAKDGKFSFDRLEAGHYDIQVDAIGFKSAYSSIVVVKPTLKGKQALQVLLDVGMGCSIISEVESKKIK